VADGSFLQRREILEPVQEEGHDNFVMQVVAQLVGQASPEVELVLLEELELLLLGDQRVLVLLGGDEFGLDLPEDLLTLEVEVVHLQFVLQAARVDQQVDQVDAALFGLG